MANVSNRNRQAAGQPVGGQFATEAKDTATGVSLGGGDLRTRLADLPPVDFDTEQYALYEKMTRQQSRCDQLLQRLRSDVSTRDERYRVIPYNEVMDRVRTTIDDPGTDDYRRTTMRRSLDDFTQADEELAATRADFDTYDEVFTERGGWNRAFLVTGANGHVHSSMGCSTCNRMGKATRFQWMTDYSDHSETEIVADAGYRACTTCYPSAPLGDEKSLPTKMFSAEEEQAKADRAEREQAKAAKQAKAKANAATASGEPLRVRTRPRDADRSAWMDTEEFKTERSAVIWYTDSMTYGRNADSDAAREDVVAAIAAKRGVDATEVRDELETKARKKMTKQGVGHNYTEPDLDEVQRNADRVRATWAD